MDIAPGVSLGPYKILQPLGSGGMGAVYLAYDERLDRRVALKVLTKATGDEATRQLRREARAIARLNHPNIAAVYDVVEHAGDTFIVMEYVDGEPLSTLVTSPPVAIDRALDVGLQLADALAYAHHEGIIHRDIKPGNVMLTRDRKVKVLDLGLARVTSADPFAQTRSASEPVQSHAGTPAYMAPERLSGQPADARTDVYSAGVVLFELLTGKRPYSAPDLMTLAVNIATHPTPRVRTSRPDVPKALDDVVARAMAKDRDSRFASAQELRDGLVRVREAMTGVAPVRVDDPRKKRHRSALIGATVIAILAIVAWFVARGRTPPAPVAAAATVAIPPAFNDSTGQADLDELGSLLQSVLSRNLTALPGITIVRAPVTAAAGSPPDKPPSQPPTYTAALRIRRALSGIVVDADLQQQGDSRPAPHAFSGDELKVLRSAVEGVTASVQQRYRPGRPASDAGRDELQTMPTTDGQALVSYLRGRIALDTSEDAKTDQVAVSAFQEAIKRDRSFAFAHAGLSQAYSSLVRHTTGEPDWLDRAKDAADQALKIDPRCDQAHLAMALVFRAAQQRDGAVVEARQAVVLTPDSDDARRILGLTLIDQGQDEAGFEELQAAAALRPRHWMNYYVLGRSLLVKSRFAEAVSALDKVTSNLPHFESAYVNLGLAQMSLGDYGMAVGNFENALQMEPGDSVALNNLATAYYWDGRFDKALESYQKAIAIDPENPRQFMNLGDTYEALRRAPDAQNAYARCVRFADARRAIKFTPDTEAIGAKCQAKLRNFDEAERRALAAVSKDPTNANVVYKLAVVYALMRQPDKALERL
ncbi:MAG TPA: protein kinase, partial [Vicinamibacterales bacterium]|nr:protein kinase [Vicinamibacterales bacterium]